MPATDFQKYRAEDLAKLPRDLKEELIQRLMNRKVSLLEFVQQTCRFTLDPWQVDLCGRLQRLAYQTGIRMLIHAPPQFGKSIIVSQRLPAWYLGICPMDRVKLAAYNVTHATNRFGAIVRDLMTSEEYEKMFGWAASISGRVSAEEYSTNLRVSTRDTQPSLKSLGLQTGFVGQGAELLIIDDPYASPEEARSEAINPKVHRFWTDTAKPRLNQNTNVVVMFHRYVENDLAGFLLDSEPGQWEMVRYSAQYEGPYLHRMTNTLFPDPIDRPVGEWLSPRFPPSWYEQQKANTYIWLSQFQGEPTAREGAFFKVAMLEVVDNLPPRLASVRAWDLAATALGGDYSVGVKMMGPDADGKFYIVDVVRGQWSSEERNKMLLLVSSLDSRHVPIQIPQDPGQAGVDQVMNLSKLLQGYPARFERPSGDKVTRADPFACQVNVGNIKLLRGAWNFDYVEELRLFPNGRNDDSVDASADAFNRLNYGAMSKWDQVEFVR